MSGTEWRPGGGAEEALRRREQIFVGVEEDFERVGVCGNRTPGAVKVCAGFQNKRHGVAGIEDETNLARVGRPPVIDRERTDLRYESDISSSAADKIADED